MRCADRLGLVEVGAVAVVDRERARSPARGRPSRRGSPSRGRRRPRPDRRRGRARSSGPLDLPAADPRVAHGLGDLDRLDGRGRPSSSARRSRRRRASGSRASSAATPSAALRVGTTAHGPIGHRGDLARGQHDVRVVRQDEDLVGRQRRRSPRAARRCSGCATGRRGRSDGELVRQSGTARRPVEPVAGGDGDDAERQAAPPASPAPSADSPRPRPDRGRRRRRRATRTPRRVLAHVAGLVVEVLDADPAQRAERQPVADDEVGPLVVDVDLERPRVAGDEHRLADRLEVDPDRVDVERPPAPAPGAGTSSRSRTPRRRGRRASTASGRLGPRLACPGRRCLPDAGGAGRPGTAGTAPGRRSRRPRPRAGSAAARRPGDRRLGRVDRRREDRLDVVRLLRPLEAAAADSRMTVRIVPSTGLATAP